MGTHPIFESDFDCLTDMSELEEWVYEQRMAKWRAEHFATTASVTTHFVLQSNTPPSNQTGNLVELLLQQQNQQQQQTPQLRNAKACVPSVLKRVLAELIDSLIIIVMRVLVLLIYYSNFSLTSAMNPTADVYEKIINDLHNTIILQSSIIDDNLLMEIDFDDDLVQTWLATLWFRFATFMYEGVSIALFSGTVGKLLMGLRVVEVRQIEWDDAPRYTRLKLTNMRYAGWRAAFVRSFMKNISSLLMIPGHLTPLFNKMRRAIYDSVAGTIVVNKIKFE